MTNRSYTLEDLAGRLGAELDGDPALLVEGIGSLQSATPTQISHLSNSAYRHQVAGSNAGALILSKEDQACWPGNALLVSNPYLAFARVSQLFARPAGPAAGNRGQVVIAGDASVADSAVLASGVVIGPRSRVEENVSVHANVVIGADCVVGAGTQLMANAVLGDDVHLGPDCVVHSAAVIGSSGFGYTPDEKGELVEIAQLGGVRVGARVRIGASTTVDRGALDNTVIEDGVKIDNQVQIGHNCHIGAHSIVCGCVGIVGSTRIGRHCVLAGGVGIGGDGPIEICDQVVVTGMTHVSASISDPGIYSGGVLHSKSRAWKRNALRFRKLDNLYQRMVSLEKAVLKVLDRDKKEGG